MEKIVRTRIAPTPSGYLHKGNLFSFLLTWLISRKTGGEILLRIDDLDKDRVRQPYIEDIFRSLEWLGIDYDIGPNGPEDFQNNYSQHRRIDLYREHIQTLIEQSGLTFNCTCSRSQINSLSPDGTYPGTCLSKELPHEKAALRIITPDSTMVSFHDNILGQIDLSIADEQRHFIVRKKDQYPAYQIASLVDDIHYAINTVVRGSDLISSTAAQLFLAENLLLSGFSKTNFYHHPLIEKGEKKISKSQGDGGVEKSVRNKVALLEEFSTWIGVGPAHTIKDLLDQFDMVQLKDVGRSSDELH